MKKTFSQKLRLIIANFSIREKTVFMIACVLFIVGAFGGLVNLSNRWTTPVPVHGGTYREAIVGSPRFINPVLAVSDADRDLTALVYSGLVRAGEQGTLIPDLAESWTISEDGKTYQFVLKPNLKFHDGHKATSNDIVFTIQKIQDPVLKSPLRIAFDGVTATAPDASTVVFQLEKPYAGFLGQLTVGILPQHIWAEIPDAAWATDEHNTEPVGTGPYRITDVSRSSIGMPETFRLDSFRKFALGRPNINRIIIDCVSSRMDAYDAFDSGKTDAVAGVEAQSVATLSNGARTVTAPLPRVFGLFLNPSKNKLFTDAAVIKALNIGIDKTAIIDAVFAGYAHPLSGPLPQMTEESSDYAEKKDLAEKTLDAAGWKLNPETHLREKTTTVGKTSSKQVLTFSIATAGTPELQKAAQMIADQLMQIGIHADIKVFEIGNLNEHVIRGRDFEALLFGEIVRHDTDLYAFWHSSQKTDPGLNITGYASARVDQLLESALRESDAAKRFAIYDQIKAELAKTASVVFLYSPDYVYLTDDRFDNIVMPAIGNPSDRFSLIHTWYRDTNRVWNGLVRQKN